MISAVRVLLLLALALIAGCGSAPVQEVTYYLLRSEPPRPGVTNLSVTPVIGIGTVRVAPYLLDDGIVLERSDGEVRTARMHRWSEPLDESLRLIVSNRVSAVLGRPLLSSAQGSDVNFSVDLSIEEWHATEAGVVHLVARWVVRATDSEEATRRFRFSDRAVLAEPGYAALVQAHLNLGERLADAVAGTLAPLQSVQP